MTDNHNWLAEYVQTGSDAAFRELVIRYVDLVYSTALRLVGGDTHRAEDVAQMVFVNLDRVARTLPEDVKLGGWLHRDTCFTASTLMRGERRRQSRERQAAEMNALQNNSDADYSLVAPVLDEAINELDEADRTAILLRFFEQNDFRSVGQALGSNEDAARMRVTRALEKLEGFLKHRGVTTTATSLGVVLSANAVQIAPVGLAVTISTAAALAGTTTAATVTATAAKTIAMTTLQKTIIGATLAAAVSTGIYETRRASTLRTQVQTLQQQQAPLAEEIQQLTRDQEDATKKLAVLRDENERLKRSTAELPRLRGEVARLLNASRELIQSKATDANDAIQMTLRSWDERVKLLKRRFEQWPGKNTPELELLSEQDWLNVTASRQLETEEDSREAMSALRLAAKGKFSEIVNRALEQYAQSNNDQLPSDLSQLKPYLLPPLDSFLESYEIAKPGSVIPPSPGSPNSERAANWAMIEKGTADRDANAHADRDYDQFIIIYRGGWFA